MDGSIQQLIKKSTISNKNFRLSYFIIRQKRRIKKIKKYIFIINQLILFICLNNIFNFGFIKKNLKKYYFTFKIQRNTKASKPQVHVKKQVPDDYRRGPYRVYSDTQKSNALRLLKQGMSYKQVSQQLEIPIKNLRRWLLTGGVRKKGGGRKQLDSLMEDKLNKWILQTIEETGRKVSRSQIREKALAFSRFKDKFKASKGWTDKFVRKYNLKRAAMKQRLDGEIIENDGIKQDIDEISIKQLQEEFQRDEFDNFEDENIYYGQQLNLDKFFT